jgi:hypothetical protein
MQYLDVVLQKGFNQSFHHLFLTVSSSSHSTVLVDIVDPSHNRADSSIHSSAEPMHTSFVLASPLVYSNAGWDLGL